MNKRKAMIWYAEFVIAVFIFLIAIGTYFEYRNNILTEQSSLIGEMIAEGKILSTSLVSGGIPINWTLSTVKQIGLTDGNYRINTSKLQMFASMDTDDIRDLYHIKNKFYVQFLDRRDNIITTNGLLGIGDEPIDDKERVSMTRIVIFNQSIVKMRVDLWR